LNPITSAEARPGYRLWVKFADGVEGEVTLDHLVGEGVFAAWENLEVFLDVAIDPVAGTVVWPGGIDLAPDGLYARITRGSASSGTPQSS
jgi:hypothetical protein